MSAKVCPPSFFLRPAVELFDITDTRAVKSKKRGKGGSSPTQAEEEGESTGQRDDADGPMGTDGIH